MKRKNITKQYKLEEEKVSFDRAKPLYVWNKFQKMNKNQLTFAFLWFWSAMIVFSS